MHAKRTVIAAVVAMVTLLVATTAATANNGLGRPPTAPSSTAGLLGGADVSDGLAPADGGVAGGFTKGSESYNGSSTTTLVDFSLPAGVNVVYDPVECGDLDNGGYCLGYETNCDPSADQVVTVNGNSVEFRLACDPGEGFEFEAGVTSLLPEGTYDASVQFKVGALKRAKPGPNMWQIQLPDAFGVPFLV